MQPIDNSDLAWLIISDFLLDQNKISESEELRDLVNNPEVDVWSQEFITFDRVGGVRGGIGTVGSFGSVGVSGVGDNSVGNIASCIGESVGSIVDGVGSSRFGIGVGGGGV